mmetsp:Transcript_46475/g.140796  ORF Transcript_46475/g.140796 Transcript_46475/m.140796 type:complete len:147 (+) Transcript_46475:141-581(+)
MQEVYVSRRTDILEAIHNSSPHILDSRRPYAKHGNSYLSSDVGGESSVMSTATSNASYLFRLSNQTRGWVRKLVHSRPTKEGSTTSTSLIITFITAVLILKPHHNWLSLAAQGRPGLLVNRVEREFVAPLTSPLQNNILLKCVLIK